MSTRVLSAPPSSSRLLLPVGYQRAGGLNVQCGVAAASRVKRCLFPSDCGQQESTNLQLARLELQRQLEADCKRWNFDFVLERPLPPSSSADGSGGRLDWVKVDSEEKPRTTKTTAPTSSPHRLRQSQITDFLQPRKRTFSDSMKSTSTDSSNNKRLRIHHRS